MNSRDNPGFWKVAFRSSIQNLKSKIQNPLDWFGRSVLMLAAVILVFQLAIPPIVGVADNGDWYKIMHPAGFKYAGDPPNDARFLETRIAFATPDFRSARSRYPVSGRAVALVARIIGPIFSRAGLFDLRVLGLLHAALLLFGLALIIAAAQPLPTVPRRVLSVLLVFVLTDVGYVALFNSFYSQTASLIFLIATAGCFAMMLKAKRLQWIWFASFVVASILFTTSKPQEAPQAILLAALVLSAPRVIKLERPLLVGFAATLLLFAVTAFSFRYTSREVHTPCLFNTVFDELLRHSPDAAADLRAFNLNPELIRYAATNAFQAGTPVRSPEFQTEFFARVDYDDILFFYLARPSRLYALLARRATYAFSLVTGFGNFDSSAGRPEWARSASFKMWSDLKKNILPSSIWTLIALFIAHAMAVIVLWRRGHPSPRVRLGLAGFVILNLMAIGAFLVCAMSDGTMDIVRQLCAFNAMTDLMLIADAAAISYSVALVWQRRNVRV